MRCTSCGSENPEGNAYCGSCGAKLVPIFEKVAVQGDDGAYYCYRHKREVTRLTCGRCDKPVCTRCAIHGPAGIRCPECAKQNVAVRPMGVWNDLSRGLRGLFRAGPYTLYMWMILISLLLGSARGCMYLRQPPSQEETTAETTEPAGKSVSE